MLPGQAGSESALCVGEGGEVSEHLQLREAGRDNKWEWVEARAELCCGPKPRLSLPHGHGYSWTVLT